jgi:hypothetical protein
MYRHIKISHELLFGDLEKYEKYKKIIDIIVYFKNIKLNDKEINKIINNNLEIKN